MCNLKLSYICEFDNDDVCSDEIININDGAYFVEPSVASCEEMNDYAFSDLNSLKITKELKNEDVICDLGDYVNFYEITCCGPCSNEYSLPLYTHALDYENSAITEKCSVFLILTLIIIFYIFII